MEAFRDECGLFAIAGHRQAAHLAYLGLHALQHRGEQTSGIVASDGDLLRAHHGAGLVQHTFAGPQLGTLRGTRAIGQVGGLGAQSLPLVARYQGGQIAVGMVGSFTNGAQLRDELKQQGALFLTRTDAEVLLHLVATSKQGTVVNRLVDALWRVEGAFSLVVLSEDRLIAVRDPWGFRPLLRATHDGARVVCTDDSPLHLLGGEITGELAPGEMLVIDPRRENILRPFAPRRRAACIQELVQLAGGDAEVFGHSAYEARVRLGRRLAKDHPTARAKVVVGLPGPGQAVATGYGRVAGLPVKPGLLPADYSAAGTLEPPQALPDFAARLRWTPVPAVVSGQVVVLTVASLGTGAELESAVRLLRVAGAHEVHVRVASPPLVAACEYGVGGPTTDELAAPRLGGVSEVSRSIGADSLAYLSREAMLSEAGDEGGPTWCDACFSGEYPIEPRRDPDRDQLPLFEGSGR